MQSLARKLVVLIMIVAAAALFAGCGLRGPAAGPAAPLPPLVASPEDRKTIVAKVNGAAINSQSLIDVMNHMSAANERASIFESREEIRKKALDRLIFEELAVQEARRRGLVLGEGALDRGMATVRRNLGDEEAYKNFLASQGITDEELRSQVERALLLQRIIDQEVTRKAVVSDDAVRNEYGRQKDRFIVPAKATVDDVVLFLDQDDPASMAKANAIISRINADAEKDPAHLVPDGTFIVQRIDLDREKEPALSDAAQKLKEGEVSGVVRGSDSLHIIRLVKFVPERQKSYEEVKGQLEAKLKAAAQKKRRQEWERELRAGASIEIMGPEGRKAD